MVNEGLKDLGDAVSCLSAPSGEAANICVYLTSFGGGNLKEFIQNFSNTPLVDTLNSQVSEGGRDRGRELLVVKDGWMDVW